MLRPQSEAAPGTLQETILAAPGQELDDIPTGERDAFDVAMVGAATAAQHVDLRIPADEVAVLACQLDRTASVKIGRVVQLLVT